MSGDGDTAEIPRPERTVTGGWPQAVLVLAVLYFAAGWAGHALGIPRGGTPGVWPASGVLVAMLLLNPPRFWPALLAAAFAVQMAGDVLLSGFAPGEAARLGLPRLIEAAAGAGLVRFAIGGAFRHHALPSFFVLFVLAGLVATGFGAIAGALLHSAGPFGDVVRNWWTADAVGVLVMAPAVIAWGNIRRDEAWSAQQSRAAELAGVLIATVILAQIVLGRVAVPGLSAIGFPYLLFPLLGWLALRGPMALSVTAAAAVAGIAAANVAYGDSPFLLAGRGTVDQVTAMQVFLALVAVSTTVLAVLAQRERDISGTASDYERRVSAMAGNIPGVLFRRRMNGEGIISHDFIVGRTRELYGLDSEDFAAGRGRIADLVHPDDRSELAYSIEESAERGTPHQFTYRVPRPDGTVLWLRTSSDAPVRDDNGDLLWDGVTTDVTAETEALARAEAFERSVQNIANSISGVILRYVRHGPRDVTVEFILGRVEETFGFSPDAFEDDPARMYAGIYPDDMEAFVEAGDRAAASMTTVDHTYRYVRPDGSVRWLRSISTPRRDPEGTIVWEGLTLDVTEEVTTRRQVRRTQGEVMRVGRLGLLGFFASSMSDDMSQPLAAIGSYIEAARRYVVRDMETPSEELLTAMDRAVEQVDRTGDILTRLRALSARYEPVYAAMDLNEAVRQSVDFVVMDQDFARVRVIVDLEPELPPVQGDAFQVQQVVVNLLRNGIDAVGESGRGEIRLETEDDGDSILLRVSDTGDGIDVQERERLFETIVTGSRGTAGVGLAHCKSIVSAHGGRIELKDNSAGGAVFEVRLPKAKPEE